MWREKRLGKCMGPRQDPLHWPFLTTALPVAACMTYGHERASAQMSEHESLASRVQKAQRTARQLVVEGAAWLVYELPPTPFDRRTAPSLVFESDTAVRRVRTYPADWRSLTDDALFALSWAA